MTTTNPSQKDHLQHAVEVLEAENAELRQMATVLLLQIQGLRGGQQSNGPRDSAGQSGASHSNSELMRGRASDARALASISACSHCLRLRPFL